MTKQPNILQLYSETYEREKQVRYSLKEYLETARDDPSLYCSAAERMVQAIGQPKQIDTSSDTRLGRIFMNRTIKLYPAFDQFYGLEETIERIVGYFRHAAQGFGGAKANPVFAWARRRRQKLSGRSAQTIDAASTGLRLVCR